MFQGPPGPAGLQGPVGAPGPAVSTEEEREVDFSQGVKPEQEGHSSAVHIFAFVCC